MKNLDSALKSRDITLPKEDHIVKAMIFPAVIYRCELDIKKAEKKKVKEESEKPGLKLNIQKTKIMVAGAITS